MPDNFRLTRRRPRAAVGTRNDVPTTGSVACWRRARVPAPTVKQPPTSTWSFGSLV